MSGVLMSAPAEKPWSNGPHLATALRDVAGQSALFDFRGADDPDAELLALAGELAPVLHVAWKGERFRPETLRRLSAQGVFNVLWHPDASVPDWLPPLADAADLCCVQSRGMLPEFRRAGIRDPEWLMEGFTPACYAYETVTPEEREQFTCDVTLVGTIDRVPGYRRRLRALNCLIREGLTVRWWGRRMSLRRNPPWLYFSPARRAWGGQMVWNDTFAKACHCARIHLALPRRAEVPGGLSNRAFMATGVGAFYLSLYRQGMEEFFTLGEEVEAFHDEDEMVQKVRYYLEHEEERRRVARAGQKRALACYTNQHTFRRLLRLVAERGGPLIQPLPGS